MFSTFKQKLLLIAYVIIILSIPLGSYLVSQQQNLKSKAAETKQSNQIAKVTPRPKPKPTPSLLDNSSSNLDKSLKELLNPTPTPEGAGQSPTIATSFGPTLSLKVSLEGRPKDNQKTKLFVGILEGTVSLNPKFLLTFMVDVPSAGSYGNLSLAGLSTGSKYTAILKGTAQIATSSAFVMNPAETKLNNGEAVNLTTGDLNEDNVINSADYSIIQKAYGSKSGSANEQSSSSSKNWNENVDFNKDGVINTFDNAIVIKNLGKIGDSGVWTSTTPQATKSASLSPDANTLPVGSVNGSDTGYWIWVPQLTNR